MKQKALVLSLALTLGAGLSCDSSPTRPPTTGGISVVLLTSAGIPIAVMAPDARAVASLVGPPSAATASVVLDGARVTVTGPTNKTVTSTTASGGNFDVSVTGLTPGSYTVTVEGLVGGEVANFGQTFNVIVTAGNTTSASVTFPTFKPDIAFSTVVDTADVLRFTISFDPVLGATGYIIAVSKNQNMSGAVTRSVTETSVEIQVPDEGKYYVTVRAVNSVVTTGGVASAPKAVYAFQGVASVTVSPASPSIAALATQQFTAEGRDADNVVVPNVTWIWISDKQSVATINPLTGLATGVSGGTATITAIGKSMPGTATLTVGVLPTPAPAKLVFSIQPTNTTAGDPLSPAVQVEIQDAAGNRVQNARDGVTIAFANNAGGGTLSGTKTVNAIDGIASFSGLSINKSSGGYTLGASSGSLTVATSNIFAISPAAPAKVAFDLQPVNVQGNIAMGSNVSVRISDAFDNFVSTATNTITLSIGDNTWKGLVGIGATLTGATSVPAVAGVATFSGLKVDKPGPGYTLAASGTGLSTATSGTFNVNITISQISAGTSSFHSCAIATGGTYCWGFGSSGQLGALVGFTGSDSIASLVRGGLTFTSVTEGQTHTCGLAAGGAAYCWGFGGNGRLGNGGTANSDVPVLVSGNHVFASIDAGGFHTCGITTASGAPEEDRQVYCWGVGSSGQLGDGGAVGALTQSLVPLRVVEPLQTMLRAVSVSAGNTHTCAVSNGVTSTSGAAYCWGTNSSAQLGDGIGTTPASGPTVVAGGFTWTSVSAGTNHTCGISVTGANTNARCWGRNVEGQLGDGAPLPGSLTVNSPVLVAGALNNWTSVKAGGFHSCGIAGGVALCWGQDSNGELGDDNQNGTNTSSPVLIAGGLSFLAIDASANHSCGRTATAAYCWGTNSVGRLGSPGVNQIKRAPTQIVQ